MSITQLNIDILISNAQRAAAEIGSYGWRPDNHDIQQLRFSIRHAPAYLILSRAWRRAGFKATAVRKLAGRVP